MSTPRQSARAQHAQNRARLTRAKGIDGQGHGQGAKHTQGTHCQAKHAAQLVRNQHREAENEIAQSQAVDDSSGTQLLGFCVLPDKDEGTGSGWTRDRARTPAQNFTARWTRQQEPAPRPLGT